MVSATTVTRTIGPHSIEAEISVLGAAIQDREALRKAGEILRPGDFYLDTHRNVFSACLDLFERNEPVDLVTLANELMRRKQLEEIIGPNGTAGTSALSALVDAVPTAANVAFHANIVRELVAKRQLLQVCLQTVERIRGNGTDAGDLTDLRQAIARLDGTQDQTAPPSLAWPTLDPAALYGLAGKIVRAVEPYSEADPAGILVHVLVPYGSMLGRGPHFRVAHTRHWTNLFAVCVGATASGGRKGESWSEPGNLCHRADETWRRRCVKHGGLSSGEGLIYHVRDATYRTEAVKQKGRPTGETETVLVDEGVADKRLLILESEFASVLKVGARDGNILSPILRQAWDGVDVLSPLIKTSPTTATGAHISLVGHITPTELLRLLTETETANGWANRFLWVCVRRSKELPEGPAAPDELMRPLAGQLTDAVNFARSVGEIKRDKQARDLWHAVYSDLSAARAGLVGAICGRAEAQTMRLAMLYALLDRSPTIRVEHLSAALALWRYAEASIKFIFSDKLGDPVADTILTALRERPEGMTRTEINDLFGGHRRREVITQAIDRLARAGLVRWEKTSTGGRPTERWYAVSACGKRGQSGKSGGHGGTYSASSAFSAPKGTVEPGPTIQLDHPGDELRPPPEGYDKGPQAGANVEEAPAEEEVWDLLSY